MDRVAAAEDTTSSSSNNQNGLSLGQALDCSVTQLDYQTPSPLPHVKVSAGCGLTGLP